MKPCRTMGDWGNGCCLLLDPLSSSSTKATETTQTTSGNARGVAGNKNQYIESGSIGVGNKGSYVESGGINNAGQKNSSKYSVAKGGSLVIYQGSPAPTTAAGALNSSTQPIAGPGTVPPPDSSGITPIFPSITDPAIAPTSDTSTSSGLWQTIQDYWSNFSIWQKIGGGVVLVLIGWLIFHKRD